MGRKSGFPNSFPLQLISDIPLNQDNLSKGAIYLSFYNELFINGERDIGNDRRVDHFDRNRFFTALGYSMTENLKSSIWCHAPKHQSNR